MDDIYWTVFFEYIFKAVSTLRALNRSTSDLVFLNLYFVHYMYLCTTLPCNKNNTWCSRTHVEILHSCLECFPLHCMGKPVTHCTKLQVNKSYTRTRTLPAYVMRLEIVPGLVLSCFGHYFTLERFLNVHRANKLTTY